MKLLFALLLLMTTTHAFADEPVELPIWQSADDQSFDDTDLNAEAIWLEFENDNSEYIQQVYRPVGPGSENNRIVTGTSRSMEAAQYRWVPCTPAMLSRTQEPGMVPTLKAGWYRNPNYVARPGKQCARIH